MEREREEGRRERGKEKEKMSEKKKSHESTQTSTMFGIWPCATSSGLVQFHTNTLKYKGASSGPVFVCHCA